jgi:phage terminase small subunit
LTKRQTSTPRQGKAKPNLAHDKFVQAYLTNGQNAQAAYLAAYPKCKANAAAASASRLLKDVKIQQRINSAQTKVAERTEHTLESLVKDAYDVFGEARADGQFAAAIAAIKEVGVLTGLRVERQERDNKNINYAISDEPISEADWVTDHVTQH